MEIQYKTNTYNAHQKYPVFAFKNWRDCPAGTLGAKLGFREDDSKFFNVSLGQGQELVAEKALDHSFQKGCCPRCRAPPQRPSVCARRWDCCVQK